MTKVYLIRHAQSLGNVKNIYGTDAPLSNKGVQQVEAAHEKIIVMPDLVISGSKMRHIQTARILFPFIYSVRNAVPAFDELYFGDLETLSVTPELDAEILQDPLIIYTKYGGDDAFLRADDAIKRISGLGRSHPDKTIAIVTSQDLMQFIRAKIESKDARNVLWTDTYSIDNCGYWYLEVDTTGVITSLSNQTAVEQTIPESSLFRILGGAV